LCVYAPSGELVRKLVDRNMPAGLQEIMWDGTNVAGNPVASGVYVYRLTVGKLTLSKKMILLK
jgi:flagellar hook assembly protein FlgD